MPQFCILFYANYTIRRVARIRKRGGLFWKSEKCAYDVDSNFHWPWISFRRLVRNLRRNVSETSEIQTFFPPKVRWSPKKKKRSSPKFRVIFLPSFASSNVWGGLFLYGGAIFHFSHKIGLKSTKYMRFCILHKPMGGGSSPPPPPPLATLLYTILATQRRAVALWPSP